MSYFLSSQFPTIISTIFFLKFVICLYGNFWSEAPFQVLAINHKWWVQYRLNYFKITGNNSSLVILVNDAKYIHFYPTFQLPTNLSHCKYKPFIKSIKFGLFCCKHWLKFFFSNIIIDSNIIQFENVYTVLIVSKLFEVGCLHTACNRLVAS